MNETVLAGFKLPHLPEKKAVIRFQPLSVNRTLELMSPQRGIFNQEGHVLDWKALFEYAVTGDTRFVWEETSEGPKVLDYERIFGVNKWRLFANVLHYFVVTGEIFAGEFEDYLAGTPAEIERFFNESVSTDEKDAE